MSFRIQKNWNHREIWSKDDKALPKGSINRLAKIRVWKISNFTKNKKFLLEIIIHINQ